MTQAVMLDASAWSPAQRRAYWEDHGFLVLRGLLRSADIEEASHEADLLRSRNDLISTRNLRCRFQTNVLTGECQFETFDPIVDIGPVCRRLAFDARLLSVLAELYDDEPCLFKDKLIYKPPGVKGYGLHQDWIAWPGFPRSFLTVLAPLDDADADNGCTEVFGGYHCNGSLTPQDGQYHELPPETVDPLRGVLLELRRGDVAIFGGFTPHRSAPNRSGRWRRQLYLSYNARNDGGEQRAKHYDEFHRWLRVKYAEYNKADVYFE
jgi:ectoine hydroxylase-related dioxygenase (phytanoyl-CoA dioxygenase family)